MWSAVSKRSAAVRRDGRAALRRDAPPPAPIASLLVVALVVLLPASAKQSPPPAAAAAASLAPAAVAAPIEAPLRLASANAEIDAVASALARRYRVSQEATRTLVGTAYGEGRRIGLDPLLILAVVAVESRFNPIAQSEGGAVGLMQVIPRYHAAQFAAVQGSVLDPRINIALGAKVLKEYIRRGGTEVAGLQLYNGAAGDTSSGYASKVLAERGRLQDAVRRARVPSA